MSAPNAAEAGHIDRTFRAILARAITQVTGREPTEDELNERAPREFVEISREFGADFWPRFAARAADSGTPGAAVGVPAGATWLSSEQLKEAESAIWYAKLHGIASITQALEWHREHSHAARLAPPIRVCADEYHIVKRCEGRAVGTRSGYRKRLAPFVAQFGDRQPMSITPEEIAAHLDRWPQPATKANHWETLSTFFQWLVKMRYAVVNPLPLALKRPTTKAGARLIFTPEEAEYILRETMETDQIGFWVLALFAGLRNTEIEWIHRHRTPWRIIDLRHRRINLSEFPTKTSRRVIPIPRALRSWLNWVRARQVPLYPPSFWERFRVVRAKVLGPRYASDDREAAGHGGRNFEGKAVYAMARRSYMSYRVALAGASFREVSDEIGNTETFIRSHFYRKATPEDARRYFGLAPRVVRSKSRPPVEDQGVAAPRCDPPDGASLAGRTREFHALRKRVAQLEQTLAAVRDAQFAMLPGHYGFADVDAFLAAVRAAAHPRRGIVTDEVRTEVRRLSQAGKAGKEIARLVGISRASVYNIQKALGLLKRRGGGQ